MCPDLESNLPPFYAQDYAQPIETSWPGLRFCSLCSHIIWESQCDLQAYITPQMSQHSGVERTGHLCQIEQVQALLLPLPNCVLVRQVTLLSEPPFLPNKQGSESGYYLGWKEVKNSRCDPSEAPTLFTRSLLLLISHVSAGSKCLNLTALQRMLIYLCLNLDVSPDPSFVKEACSCSTLGKAATCERDKSVPSRAWRSRKGWAGTVGLGSDCSGSQRSPGAWHSGRLCRPRRPEKQNAQERVCDPFPGQSRSTSMRAPLRRPGCGPFRGCFCSGWN